MCVILDTNRFGDFLSDSNGDFGPVRRWIETARRLTDLKSDDADIVALAMESKTQLLVSGDIRLHADFKAIVRGKIYQGKDHIHLLQGYNCP